MATAAENAVTTQDNLCAAMAQVSAALLQLDADFLTGKVKASYSVGQQQYDWNGYRNALMQMLTAFGPAMESAAKGGQIAAGPFSVIGSAMDGRYG